MALTTKDIFKRHIPKPFGISVVSGFIYSYYAFITFIIMFGTYESVIYQTPPTLFEYWNRILIQ